MLELRMRSEESRASIFDMQVWPTIAQMQDGIFRFALIANLAQVAHRIPQKLTMLGIILDEQLASLSI